MRFILSPGSIAKLDALRAEYEKERNVNFDAPQPKIGMPIMFGGTDVIARRRQITFLEKMKLILQPNLLKDEDIKTPEQSLANLTASKLMIAACMYVQEQISRPKNDSALYRNIDSSLGITSSNYLDNEDLEDCYLAANRLISSPKALDKANAELKKAGKDPFSEKEWKEFSRYIKARSKPKPENPYSNYPITSITQPLFGAAFSYTGATIGFLGGDVVANSTNALSPKFKLTALVGSTLLVFSPGSMGVALFAPVIAGKVFTAFCSISLAHVLGVSMGILGQGVGMMVGLPLDLTYRLVWQLTAAINNYFSKGNLDISGMRLKDGAIVMNGIAIQLTPVDEIPEDALEVRDDGKMYKNGQEFEIPKTGMQLAPGLVDELKERLKSNDDVQEEQSEEEASLTSTL